MEAIEEARKTGDKKALRKSMAQQQQDITENLRNYISKYESFGVRMSAASKTRKDASSIRGGSQTQRRTGSKTGGQSNLFIDLANVDLLNQTNGDRTITTENVDASK